MAKAQRKAQAKLADRIKAHNVTAGRNSKTASMANKPGSMNRHKP